MIVKILRHLGEDVEPGRGAREILYAFKNQELCVPSSGSPAAMPAAEASGRNGLEAVEATVSLSGDTPGREVIGAPAGGCQAEAVGLSTPPSA